MWSYPLPSTKSSQSTSTRSTVPLASQLRANLTNSSTDRLRTRFFSRRKAGFDSNLHYCTKREKIKKNSKNWKKIYQFFLTFLKFFCKQTEKRSKVGQRNYCQTVGGTRLNQELGQIQTFKGRINVGVGRLVSLVQVGQRHRVYVRILAHYSMSRMTENPNFLSTTKI